jgi:hypothetical protein
LEDATTLSKSRGFSGSAFSGWSRISSRPPTAPIIRITPSAAPSQAIGERALPFYFGSEFDAPWNVDALLQCAPDQPLSYHDESEAAFNFDLFRRPFYRVEGHLGKSSRMWRRN